MPRASEIGAHGGPRGVHGVNKVEEEGEEEVLIVEVVVTKDPKVMVVEIKVVEEEGANGVDVVVLIKVCDTLFNANVVFGNIFHLIYSFWQSPNFLYLFLYLSLNNQHGSNIET